MGVVSVLCSLSCLLDFIDTWSWGIDISGVFPKGSKKMSVVWILPGSMWKASLAFCLSCKRALCSLRGQRCISVGQHLCRASTSQTWLGRGQKPVLPLNSTAVSCCSVGCAPQPYHVVIFTVSLPKTKWGFCCLGRGCFLDGITGVEIPAECSSYGSRRKRSFNQLIVFSYSF